MLRMTVKMMISSTTLESHTEKQMNQRSTVQRILEWDMFRIFYCTFMVISRGEISLVCEPFVTVKTLIKFGW